MSEDQKDFQYVRLVYRRIMNTNIKKNPAIKQDLTWDILSSRNAVILTFIIM